MSQSKTQFANLHFNSREIEAMAEVLCSRFGVIARGVAEFLAFEHERKDDPDRSRAWTAVAEYIATAKTHSH